MIVVVAISERQVIVDQFNPEPLATTGPAGIFSRSTAQTEARLDVEIVGVFTTLENAALGRERFALVHPGRRYVQKIAHVDEILGQPEPASCIGCGVTTGGPSRCNPCQQKFWEECRAADPELVAS